MKTILKAEKVTKVFAEENSGKTALSGVDLTVNQGDYIAVMGPSGSGKSTLLYNISGLDRMTLGSVEFEGQKLEDLSENELAGLRLHKMGFVFQQNHLIKNLNIKDNIMASAFLAGRKPRKEIHRSAEQLMDQTGISELGRRHVSQASGGQLQRASLCRALINEPRILFGDEPTGALDSRSTDEIIRLFRELNSTGVTILLVTHDARVAAQAETVLYMKDGEITGSYRNAHPGTSGKEREESLLQWLTLQ